MNRTDISRATKEASEELIEQFPKILAMPRDPRGLPIPANVSYDTKNGKPFLGITNAGKEIDLFCSGKCVVTGTKLDIDDVWFVTTPILAFSPQLLLMDAPMCGEAKDFTLQVCPYFGIRNYVRLTDDQATAIVPQLSSDSHGSNSQLPSEFVAVKVTGFHGEFTKNGIRYLPSRQYTRVEFWKERTCQRAIEGEHIREEIAKGTQKAAGITPPEQWPQWAQLSLDGSLSGSWPWDQIGIKEAMIKHARELSGV